MFAVLFALILHYVATPTSSTTDDCRTVPSIKDYTLSGHAYHTSTGKQLMTCIVACDRDPNCFSINYKFPTSTCELSGVTRVSHPGDFIYTPDSMYLEHLFRSSGSCSGNSPCRNQGTCANVPQAPGYQCFCQPDYIGNLCEVCNSPSLGISDGRIPDHQITASSTGMWIFTQFPPRLARLNGSSAWVPELLDTNPYLQINLAPKTRLITRVATQGSPEHDWWTTSYMVLYSLDGRSWKFYKINGMREVFLANIDRNGITSHDVTSPFKAMYVRFAPLTNNFRSSLRIELYGCNAP